MSDFRIIKPVDVTDARLNASNVPEDDETEWDNTTTYATGDKVMVTDPGVHKRYESVTGSNTDNYPPDDDGSNWLELGATNRWAMFRQPIALATKSNETYSEATYAVDTIDGTAEGIAVTLEPGVLTDAIALFNLSGAFADIKVETSDGVAYERRINLVETMSDSDWWTFFFGDYERITEFARFDLPLADESKIFVSVFESDGNKAECGALVVGRGINLGVTTYGTSHGIVDFSRKDRDTFGNPIITERRFAREVTYDVFGQPRTKSSFVQRRLAEVRATPVVYEGSPDDPATLVYGFFKEFDIVLTSFSHFEATVEVEGLT